MRRFIILFLILTLLCGCSINNSTETKPMETEPVKTEILTAPNNVEDKTIVPVESETTVPEEAETEVTEPMEDVTKPDEENKETEPIQEETQPEQETTQPTISDETEPPIEETEPPVEENTEPEIEEPLPTIPVISTDDFPYEMKLSFDIYKYDDEIPFEYKSDVKMIVNLIENSFNDFEEITIWNKDDDYLVNLESYLRLYYTEGYDLEHPHQFCSCLFIHGWTNSEDEYGNKMMIIDLDIEHCREVANECRDWKVECLAIRGYMPFIIAELDLNGYTIHDLKEVQKWICANAVYDWDSLSNTELLSGDCQELSGLMYDGKIVCGGYANAFKRICNYIGLDVQYVSGLSGGEGHAWNSIDINGETLYIDACWDDTELEDANGPIICYYDYFLKTKEYFEEHGHVFQD